MRKSVKNAVNATLPFGKRSEWLIAALICHQEISRQISSPLTLHGVLVDENQSLECRQCHPEHRGAIASLTEFSCGFSARSARVFPCIPP